MVEYGAFSPSDPFDVGANAFREVQLAAHPLYTSLSAHPVNHSPSGFGFYCCWFLRPLPTTQLPTTQLSLAWPLAVNSYAATYISLQAILSLSSHPLSPHSFAAIHKS